MLNHCLAYLANIHGRFGWNEMPFTRADFDSKLTSILSNFRFKLNVLRFRIEFVPIVLLIVQMQFTCNPCRSLLASYSFFLTRHTNTSAVCWQWMTSKS